MNKEKGFIPVMLTPFKDNGEIDYKGLTTLTELYLNAGAAGLFANCLSSEMFELSPAEMLEMVNHVVEVSAGRVPVVATGTFNGSVTEQASFVKQIYDQGVEAVIVTTGLMAAEQDSDAQFNEQVFKLIDLTENIPLGFYECPVPYKRVLSPQQLSLFVETGRVIYHKDTSLDISQVREKNSITSRFEKFGLYDAYMEHAVDSLKAGSAGLSCIQGNFFPELIVWLCKHYDAEDAKAEVDLVQQFFTDEMEVMHQNYPIIAKYYLQSQGLNISTFTRRADGGVLDANVTAAIDALASRYRVLKDRLEIVSVL
ncbi:MAG: dihydrodipicolinate synthase family protein [Pedobacter sp.]|nr:MAG: dihydrodipicolinate synthase family protein [Pedobacter sp.]